MSEKFVKTQRQLLRQVVNYALSEHYILVDPYAFGVTKLKFQKNDPHDRTLSDEVTKKLCAAVENNIFWKTLVLLQLYTGMRIGEVLGLSWSDLDETQHLIHVRHAASIDYEEDEDGSLTATEAKIGDTKTGSGVRDIPVSDFVFELMKAWKQYLSTQPRLSARLRANGTEDLAFPNRMGEVKNYQALRKQLDKFLDAAGLAKYHITFHRLRHTYATVTREAGVEIDTISHILGHKDIDVTSNIYVTPSKATLLQANGVIGEAIDKLTNVGTEMPPQAS